MTRKVKRFILLVGVISLAYFAGYASATYHWWPRPNKPCTHVSNANDTEVKSVEDIQRVINSGE